MEKYVHGYSKKESERLYDQASTLKELLLHDTFYPDGSAVLEVGSGVGAQTITLSKNNPNSVITSIDISLDYIRKARELISGDGSNNVRFLQADIFHLPFSDEEFDHLFICFVLEHLPDPHGALEALKKPLKTGGTITVIEGDHGSCFFHPESEEAMKAWNSLIRVQELLGGNSLIGRELYPLFAGSGFRNITVSPRFVYSDASRPEMEEGFVRKTIIAMVEGIREKALELKLLDEKTFEKGIADLHKTGSEKGSFCYTFFKATGIK